MQNVSERVQAHQVRRGLIEWLSRTDWTHAMTFVYNRSISIAQAKRMFSQFCLQMDRLKFGRRNVHDVPSLDRFQAIGCFEHIETNIHLHVSARLAGWLDNPPTEADFAKYFRWWKKCTRGAGDLVCRSIDSPAGWASYITKEFYKNDKEFILSADFHPH